MNGNCSTGKVTYVVTRKPGQATFEGEAFREGMPFAAQVTLSQLLRPEAGFTQPGEVVPAEVAAAPEVSADAA